MSSSVDGLDDPDLLDDIVAELVQEFPECDPVDIAALVKERRLKIARPSSGGLLFLEAKKLLELDRDDRVFAPGSAGPPARPVLVH